MPEINKLLDRVESNAIVVPEFQREFVWKKSQSKELINSLYEGYPIGSLLVWETEEPPEIKNDAISPDLHKLFQVLLDGQQRLTVLYLLIKDDVPPYYSADEIQKDPRDLYVNVRSGEFHYENKPVRDNPEWIPLTEIFGRDLGGTDVARKLTDEEVEERGESRFDLADRYDKVLKRIRKIPERSIPKESLPKSADVHEAIELFDLINSQGTHLSDAELALAHMSAEWPQVRRRMKEKRNELAEKGFEFNLNFYVKALIAVVTNSMTYEKVYDTPRNVLEDAWDGLASENGALDYLVDLLEHEGYIPDSSYVTTRDALIPLLTYIYKQDKRLTDEEKRAFLRWLYAALMWRRYGGSADTTIESDLSLLESERPTVKLMEEIRSERGRIELEGKDLDKRTKRSKHFYNMVRIIVRAEDPVDWATGQPLQGQYDLESHHIFPKSRLYKIYDGRNSEHRKLVNEVANRAFITPRSNKELGDAPPEDYLPEIMDRNPSALRSQFIPENRELWRIQHYEEFLKRRRKLLAEAINEFMADLAEDGDGGSGQESPEELIARGESERVEYKETFLWDVYREQPNKGLKAEVAREVAALANREGGVLLIGVDDQQQIQGIDRDLKVMKKGRDDFELQLNQELRNRLGSVFASVYTNLEFETVDGKTIAILTVDESPDPLYFSSENGKEFIVRQGSSSVSLDVEEAKQYLEANF